MALVSLGETLWYIFFISAGLLLLFLIIFFMVFFAIKRDEHNKKRFDVDNFDLCDTIDKNNEERR